MQRPVILILCCAVLTLTACHRGGSDGGSGAAPVPSPVRISIAGAGSLGIFDPSLARDPATGRLWMSFSEVNASSNSLWGVGLRLGYSDDAGLTWVDAGVIDPQRDVTVGPLTVTGPGEPAISAGSPGTWQSETSTIVYDPNAVAGERWKILWHQILWANNSLYLASYSWIGMKAAATPQGLAAATPVKLFGGFLLKSDGQNAGSPAFAPIAGAPQIALDTKHAELSNCVFGEPGMLANGSGLYLSLTCHWLGPTVQPYIVLFHCANPCSITNGANWTYLGRLITPADAQAINAKYAGMSAPALFQKAGTTYLIATPVEPVGSDMRYDGCRVYRFTDLATGQLERSAGLLVQVQRVNGIAGTHHGACAHHANHVGTIYSQLVTSDPPEIFRLYQSWVDVP